MWMNKKPLCYSANTLYVFLHNQKIYVFIEDATLNRTKAKVMGLYETFALWGNSVLFCVVMNHFYNMWLRIQGISEPITGPQQ